MKVNVYLSHAFECLKIKLSNGINSVLVCMTVVVFSTHPARYTYSVRYDYLSMNTRNTSTITSVSRQNLMLNEKSNFMVVEAHNIM